MSSSIQSIALLGLALAVVSPCPGAESTSARPNIVVILADDLGYADVGFHGSDIKTPNIDRLAASGARLEQFYVQPVCSPTRAALLTGRYPMRHGLQVGVVRPWAQYGLPLTERTLPQALQEAGYETALCGKWHLGHFEPSYLPTRRGFDHQYGHYNGALDYFTHLRDGGFDWHKDDKVNRDEGYSTHLLAREAARLVREHDRGKPLFLYLAFNAVHAPHQVPEKYLEPYRHLPEPRRTYAGMLAAMDEGIGEVIGALEAKGLIPSTLIIFSSDNGGPQPGKVTSNGLFRAGKGTLYEGGVRVAACVTWPGRIQPGSIVNQPIHIVDWYPTLLKLAGASLDQKQALDGRDIWPTLTGGRPSPHDEILLNTTPRTGAIRVGDWKWVLNGQVGAGDGENADANVARPGPARAGRGRGGGANAATTERIELFNLASDPYEKKNLAAEMPEKVRELRTRYEALARQALAPQAQPKTSDFVSPKVWGEKD